MISFFVVALLWTCPTVKVPVIGEVGKGVIAKTPGRILLCTPSPGAPERFDHINDALVRIKALGPGSSLSVCDPDGTCKLQKVEWDNSPSVPVLEMAQ